MPSPDTPKDEITVVNNKEDANNPFILKEKPDGCITPNNQALPSNTLTTKNVKEISMNSPTPKITHINIKSLSCEQEAILGKLFADFSEIMVSPVLGGKGGANLFLVKPIKADMQCATFIAKIGWKWETKEEFDGAKIAEESLQNYCARIEGNIFEYNKYAGFKYTFAGTPLQTVKTFKEFYKKNNTDNVQKILDKYFKLSEVWYGRSSRKREFPYKDFYNILLPADCSIEEASLPKNNKIYTDLEDVKINNWISLQNCKVLNIRENKIKVQYGNFGYIIDYHYEQLPKGLSNGKTISIKGIVTKTRNERLKNITNSILAKITGKERKKLNKYSAPLDNLNSVLDSFYYTISIVHGDLNINNILIDQFYNPWLIDFAKTLKNGHTAFDFVELEVDIKRFILSEIMDVSELISIEDALSFSKWDVEEGNRNKFSNIDTEKAFKAIVKIRKWASNYVKKDEYLSGLYLYSLATLKFEEAPEISGKFAYISAVSALKQLESLHIRKQSIFTKLTRPFALAGYGFIVVLAVIIVGSDLFWNSNGKMGEVPKLKLVVGERNKNDGIDETDLFLKGNNVWVDIFCSTNDSEITGVWI